MKYLHFVEAKNFEYTRVNLQEDKVLKADFVPNSITIKDLDLVNVNGGYHTTLKTILSKGYDLFTVVVVGNDLIYIFKDIDEDNRTINIGDFEFDDQNTVKEKVEEGFPEVKVDLGD